MNTTLTTIAFIGGGNMASAMISGLIAKGQAPTNITVSDPSTEKAENLTANLGVLTTTNTAEAVQRADIIILAVKPQVINVVATEISVHCHTEGKVFISIAAGINMSQLEEKLGKNSAVVRLIPNISALIGYGMSGLFANENTTAEQKQQAMMVAQSCGDCIEVYEEEAINTVTALSGSGPAYFFLMMEGMIKAGTELGLSEEDAHRLTCQTALGAAQLAISSQNKLSELRNQITSASGTTESALNYFASEGLITIVEGAVNAAYDRAEELGSK